MSTTLKIAAIVTLTALIVIVLAANFAFWSDYYNQFGLWPRGFH